MEWLPKIHQLDEEAPLTLVYMNNHWQGQAAGTARQMKMLMEGAGGWNAVQDCPKAP